jgi:hypothetical protein
MPGLPEKYRRKVNESALKLLLRLGIKGKIAELLIKHIPDLAEELVNKIPIPFSGKLLVKLFPFLGKLLVKLLEVILKCFLKIFSK